MSSQEKQAEEEAGRTVQAAKKLAQRKTAPANAWGSQVNQRRRAGKLSHFSDESSNRDQAYTPASQKTGSRAYTYIYSSIKHGPKAGFQEALLGRGGGQKVARCEERLRRLWGVPGPKCLINNGNACTQASAHLFQPPPPFCKAAVCRGALACERISEQVASLRFCQVAANAERNTRNSDQPRPAEHITVLNTRAASRVITTQSMVQRRASVAFWSLGLLGLRLRVFISSY